MPKADADADEFKYSRTSKPKVVDVCNFLKKFCVVTFICPNNFVFT